MNKLTKLGGLALLCSLILTAVTGAPAHPVQAAGVLRISQVYGGGGNSGATYTNDFIEIFNSGTSPVSLAGYSVQYASSTGSTWQVTPLSGTLDAGRYYLIQQAGGALGTTPLPTPDATGTIAMGGSAGKVALVSSTTALTGTCPTGLVDFVGYGTANCSEVLPTPALSNATAALRKVNGCQDTDNNSADFSTGPAAPRNTASPASSCATGPQVIASTPAQNALETAVNANLSLTFSEAATVSEPWLSIACTRGSGPFTYTAQTTDSLTFTIDPEPDFTPNDRCTLTVLKDKVTSSATATPMLTDYVLTFDTVGTCGSPAVTIGALQGLGTVSPYVGLGYQVTEGIVTQVVQGANKAGGFFLQSEDGAGDSDPLTSNGIFVASSTTVTAGQKLRVAGTLLERFGSYGEMAEMTVLSSPIGMTVCANPGTVTPVELPLPLPDSADPATGLEAYEGMLVSVTAPLTVEQNYFLGRFGQITLGAGRVLTHLNTAPPVDSYAANLRRMVVLDDGLINQNPSPIPYLDLRAGDQVANFTGILDQGRVNSGNTLTGWPNVFYRIQPLSAPEVTHANPRPALPAVGGTLKVAGFNLSNYFVTLDGSNYSGTPYGPGNYPRGADSAAEFTRQQTKIVEALVQLDADVIGLTEMEAWTGANAVNTLVDALNVRMGKETYAAVADPLSGVGGDAIKVVLLYKPARVSLSGESLSTSAAPFNLYRYPVAQAFIDALTGEKFIVVINHWKSKNCSGGETGGDADLGLGIGCYNATRVAMANTLDAWITSTLKPVTPRVLVIGDLNAYGGEAPISTMTGLGYVNQVAQHVAPQDAYSYVFDGMAGYLDHALTTPEMDTNVTGVGHWHINADEASVYDYNTEFKTVDPYSADAYRSSDHDPTLVGLDLRAYGPDATSAEPGLSALPGTQAVFTITVKNTGNQTDTFDVALSGNVWTSQLSSVTVGPLAPNATTTLQVTVTLPAYVPFNGSDAVTVTVTSQTNPAAGDSLLLTTSAAPYRFWLPLVTR